MRHLVRHRTLSKTLVSAGGHAYNVTVHRKASARVHYVLLVSVYGRLHSVLSMHSFLSRQDILSLVIEAFSIKCINCRSYIQSLMSQYYIISIHDVTVNLLTWKSFSCYTKKFLTLKIVNIHTKY